MRPSQPTAAGTDHLVKRPVIETMETLKHLSRLVARRNAVSAEIAAILDRPAQLGHLGEFVAAELFDIALEPSANNKGHDGRFRSGALAGRSVNVKMYAKSEGMLDVRVDALPDYYLVLTGPQSAAGSSKGQDRPWVIDGIYVFAARPLVETLLARGLRLGVATSVAAEFWEAAELYPRSTCALLTLSEAQRALIEGFGRNVSDF